MVDRKKYIDEPLPAERELKLLFREDRPLLIVEAGACEGEDTIKYSRLFPGSEIYAFEPLPYNIDIARENFKKYGIDRIKLVGKALSDKTGTAKFFVSSGHPSGTPETDWDYGNKSSSLLPPDKHSAVSDFIAFNESIIVETITLDKFCKENKIDKIDLIHMDVQGAELMVLKGAADSLNFIKAIWMEVSTVPLYKGQPLAENIEKFMGDNGFIMVKDCLYGISGDRLYVSKQFFPDHQKLFPVWTRRKTFLRRILRKAGF
jgi:FkbM family methyltransferase